MSSSPRILALTGGDPAGVGPEVVLRALARGAAGRARPVVIVERSALETALRLVPELGPGRFLEVEAATRAGLETLAPDQIGLIDPVGRRRTVRAGESGPEDAAAALAAVDVAIDLARRGLADAIVTAPVSKASIARHVRPGFVGHTEHLAAAFGLERYGRDYLMAFLAPELQVALLSVHLPLRAAIEALTTEGVAEALRCLERHAGGRIAVAGLNPHAGEGGLLGGEEESILAPAIAQARVDGIDVVGPESPDSLFARQRRGEFDWTLALYHDQGLIAVKTAAFGAATNWTLGLPVVRTSVDHGTAFALAGTGRADAAPMSGAISTAMALLDGTLPRRAG